VARCPPSGIARVDGKIQGTCSIIPRSARVYAAPPSELDECPHRNPIEQRQVSDDGIHVNVRSESSAGG
jgi:hypothetical protein